MLHQDQTDSKQNEDEKRAEDPASSGRSVAEWVTLVVSGLIVAALVGAALVEHFLVDEPPGVRLEIALAVEQTRRAEDLYYVPFTVKNTGSDGAENVTVAFAVQQDDQTVEESTTQIAFLSNSGTAKGELVTVYDPASYDISARISTFETP